MDNITQRDQRIFQFLFENKIATFDHIQRAVFANTSSKANYRRLAKLTKADWLRRSGISHEKKLKYAYSLSEKAFDTYVREKDVNDREFQLTSEVPFHDLILLDIRNRFESLKTVKRFYSENVLQASYKLAEDEEYKPFIELRSDAVIEVFLQDKFRYVVPIEFEASLKTKGRNQSKILDYYIKYDGDAVLLISKDETILKSLAKTDKEISQEFKPKLYFALLSDVLRPSETITFVSSNGEKRIVL